MPIQILLIILFLPCAVVMRSPPAAVAGPEAAVSGPGPIAVIRTARGLVYPVAAAGVVRRVPSAPQSFAWPILPPHVVRQFDPPLRPWLAGHRGVDLSGTPSTVVRAAGAGTVVYAGVIAGRGVVSVAHPGGLRSTYEPVTSALHAGDAVRAGGVLGRLDPGHPECAAAACLHWGLRQGDRYLDPLALLGLGRVRLLPMAPDTPP